jgi:hypothetical protein
MKPRIAVLAALVGSLAISLAAPALADGVVQKLMTPSDKARLE